MDEASPSGSTPRNKRATLLSAEVAGQQWGVIGGDQLRACGMARTTVCRWRAEGRLHPIHRGVYAFGHASVPIEGHLVAALLYARRDAVLSHATAAWWWRLIEEEPTAIDVSSTSRVRSCPGVLVHHPRHLDATRHRGFPITSVAQTLLGYAGQVDLLEVRRALAQADYLRLLDPPAVEAVTGQGRPGSKRLRHALKRHQPKLAHARSWLETVLVPLCESAGLPLPALNRRVAGWTVDALWREQRVVVELDGYDNHSTRAQIERDRRKELALRAAGFVVIRYTWDQVVHQPERVAADLAAALAEAAPVAAALAEAAPVAAALADAAPVAAVLAEAAPVAAPLVGTPRNLAA